MYVGNKVDTVPEETKEEIREEIPDVIFISAREKIGTGELLNKISQDLKNL